LQRVPFGHDISERGIAVRDAEGDPSRLHPFRRPMARVDAAPLVAGRAKPFVDILERSLQEIFDVAPRVFGRESCAPRVPVTGQEQRENQPFQLFSLAAIRERVIVLVVENRDVIGYAEIDQRSPDKPSAVLAKFRSLRTSEGSISSAAVSLRLKSATPLRI
jgi:hypothetical protein